MAYVWTHVRNSIFLLIFCLMAIAAIGNSIDEASHLRFSGFVIFQLLFIAMPLAAFIANIVQGVRDMSVSWAITDRRVYRLGRRAIGITELSMAMGVEVVRKDDGSGSLTVKLPDRTDSDGHKHANTLPMLAMADLAGAHTAIVAGMHKPA